MKVQSLMLGVLATATAFGPSPSPAFAGTFSISPLRVELSSTARTGALTLRNHEDAPVVVQAEVFLWEQSQGEDRLTPTPDLLVSPAVFTVPGNGSQLVRVALRRQADAGRELSYRLILTEVPQQASADFSGLSVALRLSLPVFIAPTVSAKPRLEWSAVRGDDGAVALSASNTGNAHARVLSFSVAPASGTAAAASQDVTAYILPGRSRTWTIEQQQNEAVSSTDWHQLRVMGSTEDGDFEVETRLGDR